MLHAGGGTPRRGSQSQPISLMHFFPPTVLAATEEPSPGPHEGDDREGHRHRCAHHEPIQLRGATNLRRWSPYLPISAQDLARVVRDLCIAGTVILDDDEEGYAVGGTAVPSPDAGDDRAVRPPFAERETTSPANSHSRYPICSPF